jgi:ATP-dependent Zn protease
MEETAYHECGHAFMAAYLGGSVRFLTIEPDRDDGPDRFGDAQIVWRRDGMTAKEFHNKLVLVALAGPVAEMIYRGETLHPGFVAEWAHDWRQAWDAAGPILPNEQKRLAFLEEATRQLYELLRRDVHWSAVAALADNLLAHETLELDDIREVLAAWMPK